MTHKHVEDIIVEEARKLVPKYEKRGQRALKAIVEYQDAMLHRVEMDRKETLN
jgi:hypothetical protein